MRRNFIRLLCFAVYLVPSLRGAVPEVHSDHSLPGWGGEASLSEKVVTFGSEEWRGEIIQLSWEPRSYLLKGFLSESECDHLIDIAAPSMAKSTVADNVTGKSFDSQIRTSTGTFLAKKQDEFVSRIEKRVSQVTMVPEDNQEGFQILHYQDGQKYEPHHDYFHDKVNQAPSRGGQRLVTMLMYLTTVEEGGETVFPRADRKVSGPEWSECARKGMAVKAIRGDAVMFFSLHPDGTEDPTSLHGSCPTTKGEKWSATKWIHVGTSSKTTAQQKSGWAQKDVTNSDSACLDSDPDCADWAAAGECEKNPAFMLVQCARSCKKC